MNEQERLNIVDRLNHKFPDRNWMEILNRFIEDDGIKVMMSQRIAIEREINNQQSK